MLAPGRRDPLRTSYLNGDFSATKGDKGGTESEANLVDLVVVKFVASDYCFFILAKTTLWCLL